MYLFGFFQNCSLGIVGKDMDFTIYDDDGVQKYVSFILITYHAFML